MNITLAISPAYSMAQAVKFTAPESGWNLEYILVMASDGWNASSKDLPKPLPFTIDIRDANLMLLYHYEGIQLPYFTNSKGIRMATIDVPFMPLSGDFFVCFYGYGSISLAAELENATGKLLLLRRPYSSTIRRCAADEKQPDNSCELAR